MKWGNEFFRKTRMKTADGTRIIYFFFFVSLQMLFVQNSSCIYHVIHYTSHHHMKFIIHSFFHFNFSIALIYILQINTKKTFDIFNIYPFSIYIFIDSKRIYSLLICIYTHKCEQIDIKIKKKKKKFKK